MIHPLSIIYSCVSYLHSCVFILIFSFPYPIHIPHETYSHGIVFSGIDNKITPIIEVQVVGRNKELNGIMGTPYLMVCVCVCVCVCDCVCV